MPQPASPDPDIILSLPIAGQTLQEGADIEVYQYVIKSKTTCAEFKAVLASYGKRVGGTKAELKERLVEFAKKKEEWPLLFRGQQKRKRGNATSARSANLHSAKRIATMFATEEEPAEYAYRHGFDNRPIETMSTETKTNIYCMVDEILSRDKQPKQLLATAPSAVTGASTIALPGLEEDPATTSQCSTGLAIGTVSGPSGNAANEAQGATSPQPNKTNPYLEHINRKVMRQLSAMELQMRGIYGVVSNINGQIMTGVPATQPSTPDITSSLQDLQVGGCVTAAVGTTPHIGLQSQEGVPQSTVAVGPPTHWYGAPPSVGTVAHAGPSTSSVELTRLSAPSHNSASIPTSTHHVAHPFTTPVSPASSTTIPRDYKLTLVVDDRRVTYDARHVPDPPIQHFSKNLDDLFRHWTASSILTIDGDGIPLKYWPDVYKGLGRIGFKRKAWEAIKMEWCNWKFIVEAKDSFGTTDAFWNAFQDDSGARLGFQAVLDVLKEQRETADRADALAAKEFFGGDLDHPDANGMFRYVKRGQSTLLTKPAVIAQRWRALLQADPTLRHRVNAVNAGNAL